MPFLYPPPHCITNLFILNLNNISIKLIKLIPGLAASFKEYLSCVFKEQLNTGLILVVTCSVFLMTGLWGIQINFPNSSGCIFNLSMIPFFSYWKNISLYASSSLFLLKDVMVLSRTLSATWTFNGTLLCFQSEEDLHSSNRLNSMEFSNSFFFLS